MMIINFNKFLFGRGLKVFSVLLLAVFVLPPFSWGQQNAHVETKVIFLKLNAKSYGDSIVLRWAPESPIGWSMCREKGYNIYRIGLNKNGSFDTVKLSSNPVKSMSLAAMKAWAEKILS